MKYFKLTKNKEVVPCSLQESVEWFDSHNKKVAEEIYLNHRISTILLSKNHQREKGGPPLVFETMVFPSSSWSKIYCDRYSTWDEALAGHEKAKEWLKLELSEESINEL